jgi:4'-phosphopantetheinyl transferase
MRVRRGCDCETVERRYTPVSHFNRTASEIWRPPPERPAVSDSEIQVWRMSLDRSASEIPEMQDLLSEDENARAARFVFDRHRAHFIAGRASLRRILGRYVGLAPERLEFGYGPRGKPFLKTGSDGDAVRFNLSHTGELALLAVVRAREVGVDVERIRAVKEHLRLAGRYFAPGEVDAIRALPSEVQYEAFFNCWTRKEAYIKALGTGLACPLDGFEVSLAPGAPAALLRINGNPEAPSEWFLQALEPGYGLIGAVALKGKGYRVTCWERRAG